MFVRPRRIRRGAALTFVFGCALVTGAATGSWDDDTANSDSVAARSEAAAPARSQVMAAAARAMADGKSGSEAAREAASRSGDRWAAVYTSREYEGLQRALDGEYVGVGMDVRGAPGGDIEVAGVRPGSPAEKAGVVPGDRLRTIDGRGISGRPVTEVVSRLRGGDRAAKAGTRVQVGIERAGSVQERTLHRTRLEIETVSVERDARSAVTSIKVGSFAKGTGRQVLKAVHAAPDGDRFLLDLRGNSGGLVGEAVAAASAFLDGGVVATYDVHGEERTLRADRGKATKAPLVVLVDGGTMSAAELLAGALQDRGRAVVVGSRTFGKGSVQMPSTLPDGSVAELTVGHYRTPSGRNVDGEGITPDLNADAGAEQRARRVLGGLGQGS